MTIRKHDLSLLYIVFYKKNVSFLSSRGGLIFDVMGLLYDLSLLLFAIYVYIKRDVVCCKNVLNFLRYVFAKSLLNRNDI